MRAALFGIVLAATLPLAALAQDKTQTLADIRQELVVLNSSVMGLKRELSTTSGFGTAPAGGTVLERVDAIEAALAQLTAKTEALEFRINQIVADGTNRIGDLEFRLVELAGTPARLLRPLSRHQPAIAAHRSPRTSRATLIARRRRWTPETFVPLQTSLQPLRRPIRAGH